MYLRKDSTLVVQHELVMLGVKTRDKLQRDPGVEPKLQRICWRVDIQVLHCDPEQPPIAAEWWRMIHACVHEASKAFTHFS
jgi:hypothetical protein